MGIFNRQAAAGPRTAEQVYASARSNLLAVVIFTVINVVLTVARADVYFLFSATVPLFLLEIGTVLAETLPAMYAVGLVAALAGIGVYVLCYFLAKHHRGWMITALVLFCIDTVMLLVLYELTSVILDIVFHAWILYYLIVGVRAGSQLSKQPAVAEETAPAAAAPTVPLMMVNGEPVVSEEVPADSEE